MGPAEPKPTFRLLMVARSRTGEGDPHRMYELRAPAAKLPAAMQDRLWFTTVADLCRWQRDPCPLAAAIWQRGCDGGQRNRVQGHAAGPLNPDSNWLRPLFPPADRAAT